MRSHWPSTASDKVIFWHWDCYLLAEGFWWEPYCLINHSTSLSRKPMLRGLFCFKVLVFILENFQTIIYVCIQMQTHKHTYKNGEDYLVPEQSLQ